MKKLFVIAILLLSTNAYAEDKLINKVLLCTNIILHEDESKELFLFWGIKFLPQKYKRIANYHSMDFYGYNSQVSAGRGLDYDLDLGFIEYLEESKGGYTSTYNEIKLEVKLKYGKEFKIEYYTINRTTLSMKNDDHYYYLFEKGSCRVEEHIGENFKRFFLDRLKEEKLKVDDRKI